MRMFWLAATTAITLTAAAADAQRMVAHGPSMRMGGAPRGMPHPGPMPHPPKQWQRQSQHQSQSQRTRVVSNSRSRSSVHVNVRNRWGGRIGGRWWGGGRAPGGWGAYRHPVRGFVLPSYWLSPSFFISDWAGYGLSEPPYGYNWARYYDDAVLVDGRGSVSDSVDGVDWDGGDVGDSGYAEGGYPDDGDDSVYGGGDGYQSGGYQGGGDAPGAPYAYHENGDGRGPLARSGAGMPLPPPGPRHAPPPPPPPPPAGRPMVVQQGGYYANGYYYPGQTVTTVTVTSTPVVTTTTEVFEDAVTYSRPAKRVWHKRVWRAKPKCTCG